MTQNRGLFGFPLWCRGRCRAGRLGLGLGHVAAVCLAPAVALGRAERNSRQIHGQVVALFTLACN